MTVDDSRFEIVDGTLKLRGDEFVRRADEPEIQVVITAQDSVGELDDIVRPFIIDVLGNESPLHNQGNPFDVNHNGDVTAADALAIINYLNDYGPGPVGAGDMGFCYDVNADGFVTALDALLVINRLNQRPGSIVGGEGEPAPAPNAPQAPIPSPGVLPSPTSEFGRSIATQSDRRDNAVPAIDGGQTIRDATFAVWQPATESHAALNAINLRDDGVNADSILADPTLAEAAVPSLLSKDRV